MNDNLILKKVTRIINEYRDMHVQHSSSAFVVVNQKRAEIWLPFQWKFGAQTGNHEKLVCHYLLQRIFFCARFVSAAGPRTFQLQCVYLLFLRLAFYAVNGVTERWSDQHCTCTHVFPNLRVFEATVSSENTYAIGIVVCTRGDRRMLERLHLERLVSFQKYENTKFGAALAHNSENVVGFVVQCNWRSYRITAKVAANRHKRKARTKVIWVLPQDIVHMALHFSEQAKHQITCRIT